MFKVILSKDLDSQYYLATLFRFIDLTSTLVHDFLVHQLQDNFS